MPSQSSKPTYTQSKLSFGASKSAASANKTAKAGSITATPSAGTSAPPPPSSSALAPTRRRSPRKTKVEDRNFVNIDSSDEEGIIDLDDIDESQLEPEPDHASDIEQGSDHDGCRAPGKARAVEQASQTTRARKARTAVGRETGSAASAEVTPTPKAEGIKKSAVAVVDIETRPHLNVKDKAYNSIVNEAKKKMDYAHPIHGKDLNRIDDVLRVFDMDYEYGPCVGLSRLQRWERASAMGLNPPHEVKDILMTQEGLSDTRYSQNVLAGRV